MFKAIALGAILSLNICCFGSSEAPTIRRSKSGRFFDNKGEQTTMVDFYMTNAQEGTLPKEEGFVCRVNGEVLPQPETAVINMIRKFHILATTREVLSIEKRSHEFTPEMLNKLNKLGGAISRIRTAQAALLPKAKTKCTIQ